MPKLRHHVEVQRFQYHDGHETTEHAHDRHQLTYARSGLLRVTVAQSRWVVPPLRAIWLPAGVDHHLVAHGSTDVRLAYVDPQADAALLPDVTVVGVDQLLRALLEELHCDGDQILAERPQMEALFLSRLQHLPSRPLQLLTLHEPRLASIQTALCLHPGDRRTLREWGQFCGASERTLSRLFAEEVGTTFGRWRTQLRLQHALVLLGKGTSVTSVAHACGYNSTGAFIETFQVVLGTTPGKFFTTQLPHGGHQW